MSEAKTQLDCRDLARASGCLWLRLRPPPKGLPDALIVAPGGRHVWVEFKAVRGRVRPGQHEMLAELEKRKALFWIIRDTEDFANKLRTVL